MLKLTKLKPARLVLFGTEPPLSCYLTGAEGSWTMGHCKFAPHWVKSKRKLQLSNIQLFALSVKNCLDCMMSGS